MNKKIILIIVGIVVLWGLWSVVSGYLYRKSAENLVEGLTGVEVDTNRDGTATYTTDGGTISTSNKLPDNWPSDAPNYPGATITFSAAVNKTTENTNEGSSVTLSTKDETAKVVTFYKEELKKQGWEISEDANFNNITTLAAKKDSRNFSVMVSPAEEGQTGSNMIISVTNDSTE